MALTNRITGESLDQEIQHNQQAAQTEAPTLSEPPSESNDTPTQSKPRRKKQKDSGEIPLHTQLYLIEQTEAQIERLTEVINRAQGMLETAAEAQSKAPTASAEEGKVSEQTVDELAAELGRVFDGQCKTIVGQHLSDAKKESERLCRQLSKTAKQINRLPRLLIGALVTSMASLLASAVTVILLLSR